MSFHSQDPMDDYGEQDKEMMRLEADALKQLEDLMKHQNPPVPPEQTDNLP